jgi:hypothetical protein
MPRKKAVASDKRARQEYAGIPDSRPFGGSDESDEAFDARPIMKCHVGGIPVREMPLQTQRQIHYDQTDEGFAAKQAGRTGLGVSVTDAVDKQLRERDHDLKNGMDPRFAMQPLKFLDAYKRKGFKLKLLSTKKGEVDPEYALITKANGEPLKYKGMLVGERPIEDVQQRNGFYRQRAARRLAALTEKFKSSTEGIVPTE